MRICEVEDCGQSHDSHGYCSTHAKRFRRHGDPLGSKPHPCYKGGHLDSSGYRQIYVNGKPVKEHRHIMEQNLGRPLTDDETVHHINGNRIDNRLENLELWSHAQPYGQRVEDKLKYAREIIELYGNLEPEDDAHYW